MEGLNWKDRPLILKLLYILAFLYWVIIIISFFANIIRSIITRQIITILGDVNALTLSGILLKVTFGIYMTLLSTFVIIIICSLFTWVYRKITSRKYERISTYQEKVLNRNVLLIELNAAILFILTVYNLGGSLLKITELAINDSVSGPLVFMISAPLVLVVMIILCFVEIFIMLLIPLLYQWSKQLIKYMNAPREI